MEKPECHVCGSRRCGLVRKDDGPYWCADCLFAELRESKSRVKRLEDRLELSPQGDDKIDELEESARQSSVSTKIGDVLQSLKPGDVVRIERYREAFLVNGHFVNRVPYSFHGKAVDLAMAFTAAGLMVLPPAGRASGDTALSAFFDGLGDAVREMWARGGLSPDQAKALGFPPWERPKLGGKE